MSIHIAFLLYPDISQLDLTGPYEVLNRVPGARLDLVWKSLEPVRSESGLTILPTATFTDVTSADILCVPGGGGQIELMEDEATIAWIRTVGAKARYVTSVCVGSLLLGAAELLRGYRATSHWSSLPLLAAYGAVPAEERVVVDRNRITAGGVTAGIDFGVRIAAIISSQYLAEFIQLRIEYDPEPPFRAGHPRVASADIVDLVRTCLSYRLSRRIEQAQRFSTGSSLDAAGA